MSPAGNIKQLLSTLQPLPLASSDIPFHRDSHAPDGHSILVQTIKEQGVLDSKIQSESFQSAIVLTECLTEASPFSCNLDLSCFTMDFTFAFTNSCLVTKHRCILPFILHSHVVSTQKYMVRKTSVKHTD